MAPTKDLFDKHLDEAMRSLNTILVLKEFKTTTNEKAKEQQIANRIRRAELAAEHESIDEARQILMAAANEFPDSALIRDVLEELNKLELSIKANTKG